MEANRNTYFFCCIFFIITGCSCVYMLCCKFEFHSYICQSNSLEVCYVFYQLNTTGLAIFLLR